jgi:tRNA(His) 5'-end guanylyltransferase
VQIKQWNSLLNLLPQCHLLIKVENDGKEFDNFLLKQSKGIGGTNIQNRVEFLKAALGCVVIKRKDISAISLIAKNE